MPKIISATEAQSNFGAILQWAEENKEDIVVERRGKPTAAILTYEEYQALIALREQERKRRILDEIREIRRQVAAQNQDLSAEDVYRLAGFAEDDVQAMLRRDEKLATKA